MNHEQLVASTDDNVRVGVLACPGSGKTTTLVAAVNHEITKWGEANKIVIITYTNAAAKVVRERLSAPIGYCGTLHGFCLGFMRNLVNKNIQLIDEREARRMIETVAKGLGYKGSAKALEEARQSFWSKPHKFGSYTDAERVALKFSAILQSVGLIEYDLLLARTYQILPTIPNVQPVKFFFDEAQDWSAVDYGIIDRYPHSKVFAVGDLDQAIFEFRGANGLLFADFYRQSSKHALTQNYRSTPEIVEAANLMISLNVGRIPINMESAAEPRVRIPCIAYMDKTRVEQSARLVSLVDSKRKTGTVAILTRTNEWSEEIAGMLRVAGFEVQSGKEFIPDLGRVRTLVALAIDPHNPVLRDIEMNQRGSKQSIVSHDTLPAKTVTEALELVEEHCNLSDQMAELLNIAIGECPPDQPSFLLSLLRENNRPARPSQISVGTIHWSKGQEFDHVILADTDEAVDENYDDAECRLYYVGLTRARASAVATGVANRYIEFKGMQPRMPNQYILNAGFCFVTSTPRQP